MACTRTSHALDPPASRTHELAATILSSLSALHEQLLAVEVGLKQGS